MLRDRERGNFDPMGYGIKPPLFRELSVAADLTCPIEEGSVNAPCGIAIQYT
jgi:hypothetical protein